MHESIFKAMWRRFFMVIATIMAILFVLVIFVGLLSAMMDKAEERPEIKYSYAPQIEPNAKNVRTSLSATAPVILKIAIDGVIGLNELDRQHLRQILVESRERTFKDNRVKGIFLVINSPGGTVIDADGIYRALKGYKEQYKVPIYAYIDGLCASGGMYVACAADKIYASASSLVGSIGVIVPSAMNFSQLLTNYGVEAKTLYAGRGKDELNPFRPWKENEGANYQDLIDDIYKQFVDLVTQNRPNLNQEKLIAEYGAQVFPADKAVEYGYIDAANMSWNEALALLAKDLNLGEDEYQVIHMTDQNWLLGLLKGNREAPFAKGVIRHQIDLPLELNASLNSQFLYLHRP